VYTIWLPLRHTYTLLLCNFYVNDKQYDWHKRIKETLLTLILITTRNWICINIHKDVAFGTLYTRGVYINIFIKQYVLFNLLHTGLYKKYVVWNNKTKNNNNKYFGKEITAGFIATVVVKRRKICMQTY